MNYISRLATKYIRGENKNFLIGLTIIFSAFILSLTLSFSASNQIGIHKTTKYMPQITVLNKSDKINDIKSDRSIDKIVTLNIIDQVKFQGSPTNVIYLDNNNYFDSIKGELPIDSHEIMIEKSISDKYSLKIGDEIKVDDNSGEKTFTISSIAYRDMEVNQANLYVSENYFKNSKVKVSSSMIFLKDKSEKFAYSKANEIRDKFEIPKENINIYNEFFTYSNNQKISDASIELTLILLLLSITTSLVLYSIYYISINRSINELGKLRALGLKRKDLKKLIIRQAQFIAIPSGIVGGLLGILVNILIRPGTFDFKIHGLIFIATVIFVFTIACISTLRPANYASKISPVEAMSYTSYTDVIAPRHSSKKVTPLYLAMLNAKRNKKRSIFTLISLALCSVIFIAMIGVFSSISTEDIAKNTKFKLGEYNITFKFMEYKPDDINASNYKKAFTQAENNPIDEKLISKIKEIDEIDRINIEKATTVNFDIEKNDIRNQVTTIVGYKETDIDKLKTKLVLGDIKDENDLIVNNANNVFEDVYKLSPKLGDTIRLKFRGKDGHIDEKDFTISAILNDTSSEYIFGIPEKKLEELCDYNINNSISLKLKDSINKKKMNIIEDKVRNILSENKLLEFNKVDDYVKELNKQYKTILLASLIFTCVFLIFALFNVINLSITTFIERKNQIGTMMALGMKKSHFILSRIFETQIIIVISNIISIILGGIIGKTLIDIIGDMVLKFEYNFNLIYVLAYLILIHVLAAIIEIVIAKTVDNESLIKYIEE